MIEAVNRFRNGVSSLNRCRPLFNSPKDFGLLDYINIQKSQGDLNTILHKITKPKGDLNTILHKKPFDFHKQNGKPIIPKRHNQFMVLAQLIQNYGNVN